MPDELNNSLEKIISEDIIDDSQLILDSLRESYKEILEIIRKELKYKACQLYIITDKNKEAIPLGQIGDLYSGKRFVKGFACIGYSKKEEEKVLQLHENIKDTDLGVPDWFLEKPYHSIQIVDVGDNLEKMIAEGKLGKEFIKNNQEAFRTNPGDAKSFPEFVNCLIIPFVRKYGPDELNIELSGFIYMTGKEDDPEFNTIISDETLSNVELFILRNSKWPSEALSLAEKLVRSREREREAYKREKIALEM